MRDVKTFKRIKKKYSNGILKGLQIPIRQK